MKVINDNKAFTLVELLVTIVILALVMGIGGYSIVAVLNSSRENDYKLLIKNIKNGVELYYQECKYSKNDYVECPDLVDGYYQTTLGDLVEYGYLKGNSSDDDENSTLENPKDKKNIANCEIKYKYDTGRMVVVMVSQNGTNSCPDDYE